jgi:hypothetical protein
VVEHLDPQVRPRPGGVRREARVFLPRIEAVGALPTAASGGFAGRPGVEVPHLAGLYLAGDWVGPEGFLADASLASAREAARLALRTPTARAPASRPAW